MSRLMQGRGRVAQTTCSCQVCGLDLASTKAKLYCLQKKVCPTCIQVAAIQLPGRASLQRFCHQCGKFEPLENFDGPRRSCRNKLLKRRKTPSVSKGSGSLVNAGELSRATTGMQQQAWTVPAAAAAAADAEAAAAGYLTGSLILSYGANAAAADSAANSSDTSWVQVDQHLQQILQAELSACAAPSAEGPACQLPLLQANTQQRHILQAELSACAAPSTEGTTCQLPLLQGHTQQRHSLQAELSACAAPSTEVPACQLPLLQAPHCGIMGMPAAHGPGPCPSDVDQELVCWIAACMQQELQQCVGTQQAPLQHSALHRAPSCNSTSHTVWGMMQPTVQALPDVSCGSSGYPGHTLLSPGNHGCALQTNSAHMPQQMLAQAAPAAAGWDTGLWHNRPYGNSSVAVADGYAAANRCYAWQCNSQPAATCTAAGRNPSLTADMAAADASVLRQRPNLGSEHQQLLGELLLLLQQQQTVFAAAAGAGALQSVGAPTAPMHSVFDSHLHGMPARVPAGPVQRPLGSNTTALPAGCMGQQGHCLACQQALAYKLN